MSDEFAGAFGKMNGIHNVWPYWREYVQSVSTRAGMPPVTLPLMTGTAIADYYAEKERTSEVVDSSVAAEPTAT